MTMHAKDWIKDPVESVLGVGCNLGAWLADYRRLYPSARLAGIEINKSAIEIARTDLPTVEFREAGAERIPFSDKSFSMLHALKCWNIFRLIFGRLRFMKLCEC